MDGNKLINLCIIITPARRNIYTCTVCTYENSRQMIFKLDARSSRKKATNSLKKQTLSLFICKLDKLVSFYKKKKKKKNKREI